MRLGVRGLRIGLPLREFACAVGAFSLLVTAACVIVPVRVPSQQRDASGKPLDLDITFLKSGSTTRDEVTRNLAAINTEVNQSNLFWGRWDSSKWRTTAVGFVPPGGERIWRTDNLLIQFDQNAIVKTWVVVDDKGLLQQLELLFPSADEPMLDLSSPVQVQVIVPHYNGVQANLVLSPDSFEENRIAPSGARFSLKTPRANVLRIAPTPEASYYGPVSEYTPYTKPDLLVATVYLAKSAAVYSGEKHHMVGRKLTMGLDPPTFLLLRSYIAQTMHQSASAGLPGAIAAVPIR